MRSLAVGLVVVVASGAAADTKDTKKTPADEVAGWFRELVAPTSTGKTTLEAPRFMIATSIGPIVPDGLAELRAMLPADPRPSNVVTGTSSDGKVVWIAADITYACDGRDCDKSVMHATAIFENAGSWQPIVMHLANTFTAKQRAAARARGDAPKVIARKIDGADNAVQLFELTIGEPKALAASVSGRKDVVLYGSEAKERYVGGAAVQARLLVWGLRLEVRGGIRAGITAGKTVAWIAANVDATPVKKKTAKPMPYRVLFVYELDAERAWKLVQAHFSAVG